MAEFEALPQRKSRRRRRNRSNENIDDSSKKEPITNSAVHVENQGYGVANAGMIGGGFGAASCSAALAAEAALGRLKSAPTTSPHFEYLDHTADVQLHAWGNTTEEAFRHCVLAMFGYMTDLSTVRIDRDISRRVVAKGHDLFSLLFSLLDEFLYLFCTEGIVCCDVRPVHQIDREQWTFEMDALGERFDLQRHPQGTEIKAITYSAMQILEDNDEKREVKDDSVTDDNYKTREIPVATRKGKTDVFVVVDI